MTVNRTTLLDLPLPVTGTESGTWGDTTNNGLTQYLDIAIAGTLVLSTDADVTLTSTEGDSSATNIGATTAQYAILRWTATGSTTRNITALAQSKTYVVINATGGTQSIVLRGAGPTTGVTIISGEKAHCVWNGSDFVKVSSSAAAGGSNTQVQYNSSGVLAGSSNLTFDGTSLTLGGNPTLSAGTANGVLYLNGSKVATSGSALVFDGSNLGLGVTPSTLGTGYGKILFVGDGIGGANALLQAQSISINNYPVTLAANAGSSGVSTWKYITSSANASRYEQNQGIHAWYTAPSGTAGNAITFSQVMTLDASGNLGLGVTPSFGASFGKLFYVGDGVGGANALIQAQSINTNDYPVTLAANASSSGVATWKYITSSAAASRYEQNAGNHFFFTAPSGTAGNAITFTQAMTLDASGNLQLGTTIGSGAKQAIKTAAGNTTIGSSLGLLVSGKTAGSVVGERLEIGFRSWEAYNSYTGSMAGMGAITTSVAGNELVDLYFYTAATATSLTPVERVRITSGGDLLVGTTTASSSITNGFTVTGGAAVTALGVGHVTGSGDGTNYVVFNYAGSVIGSITQNGTTAVAYNTSSDYRLKDNPQPLTNSGAFIDALKPKTWEWKTDGSRGVGFIAHEVQEVSPGSVVGEKDGEQMQAMEYGSAEFIANIIAELQSLRQRVALLEGN